MYKKLKKKKKRIFHKYISFKYLLKIKLEIMFILINILKIPNI